MEQHPFIPYSQISTMPHQHQSQQNQMPCFIFGGNDGRTYPPSLSGPYQTSYTPADMRQSTEQRGQNMRNRLLNHFESRKKEFCQVLRSRTDSNNWTNDPYRAIYSQPSNTGYFAMNSNLTNLPLGKENYLPAGNQTSVINTLDVQYSRMKYQNIAHSNLPTSQVSKANPVRNVFCKSSQTSNLQFSKSQSTQTCTPCLTNPHKRSRSTQIDNELPNVIFVPIHPGHPYYPSQYYNYISHQHRPQTQAAALARQVPVQTDRPTPPEHHQVISKSDSPPQYRSQSWIVSKPSCPVGLVKPQSRQPDSQTSRIVPDDQLPSVTPVSEEHLQKLMRFNSSATKTNSSGATHHIKAEPMEPSHSAADIDQRNSTKPKKLCQCGGASVKGSCKSCAEPPKSSSNPTPEVKKEEEVYEPINPEQLHNACPDTTKNTDLNIQASDSTSINTSDSGSYASLSKVPSPWKMSGSEAVSLGAAREVNNHLPTIQFKEPPYSESEELDWDSDEDMIFPVDMTRNLVQHYKPRLKGYLSFDGNVLEYHPLSKVSSRPGTDSPLVSRQRRTVKKRRCPCCDDNPAPLKKVKHDIRIVDISGDVERCVQQRLHLKNCVYTFIFKIFKLNYFLQV